MVVVTGAFGYPNRPPCAGAPNKPGALSSLGLAGPGAGADACYLLSLGANKFVPTTDCGCPSLILGKPASCEPKSGFLSVEAVRFWGFGGSYTDLDNDVLARFMAGTKAPGALATCSFSGCLGAVSAAGLGSAAFCSGSLVGSGFLSDAVVEAGFAGCSGAGMGASGTFGSLGGVFSATFSSALGFSLVGVAGCFSFFSAG